MPMGINQTNNAMHITLDVWGDKVFYNGREYPAGYFAASVLNLTDEQLEELFLLSVEPHKSPENMRDATVAYLRKLHEYEPFSLQDWNTEMRVLDMLFSDSFIASLDENDSHMEFAARYLDSINRIPLALIHFVTAIQYFTTQYLMRLKRRDETHFAAAAHDCFNSDEFKKVIEYLTGIEVEVFTHSPALRSSYNFASHPKREKEMVFVNRVMFESYMDFLMFDLLNGLHHGHAPARCQNCGKYFLTENAHAVQYCDGIAPQNPRYTCRQYGAMQHQKEENENHPINTPFKTRTATIRQHHKRGKISKELRDKSLEICKEYRDAAFLDKKFAEEEYILLMEQEAVYAEARRRLGLPPEE